MDGYHEKLSKIANYIENADAIIIGAGSGLSSAAGFSYAGERFHRYFQDFIDHYGMQDMYSAGFYPFPSQEEKWAYWSRHIYYNRYDVPAGKPYLDLYQLFQDKNYFILTTNVDHQFWLAGFPSERIFATQGDYGLFQCAAACHKKLYDNEAAIRSMMENQKNMKIPSGLVPKCPVCGGNMEVNLRCDEFFVEDEAWENAEFRYGEFLRGCIGKRVLLLELGVGMNTPVIIKFPFWKFTCENEKAYYADINLGEAYAPEEIRDRAICLDADLAYAIADLRNLLMT